MNQELVEILLSIYQANGTTKDALCTRMLRRKCIYKCNVCPIEYMHISYFGRPHYLMHLIALMDKGNI